jgi:hypothetical protein
MAKKRFKDLSEKEILALAIQLEEEDGRVYSDFADGLRDTYPSTAKMFEDMQAEESRHRQSLIDLYQQRFGSHIPLIRRQDVKGFVERRPEWLVRPLGIDKVRKQAELMELETRYNTFPTPPRANFSATWRRSNASITPPLNPSKKNKPHRALARKRTHRRNAFSCCRSCNPASRA